MRALSWLATAIAASASLRSFCRPGESGRPHSRTGDKPAIGDFGLDLTAGNAAVKPGDDFFSYASGTWYKSFEIPPDRSSFGAFNQLDELSKQRVREIIEQAAASHPGRRQLRRRRSATTTPLSWTRPRSRRNGLAPAKADLQRIAAATTKNGHREACSALPGFASLFDLDLPPDLKNPDRYSVVISQSQPRPAGSRLLPEG